MNNDRSPERIEQQAVSGASADALASRPAFSGVARAVCAALALSLPLQAFAQRWTFGTGLSGQATWTSNAAFQATGAERDDVILQVAPRFTVKGEGARLRVNGSAALTALRYVNDSQESSVQPEVDFLANLEAVERFFFIETSYRATQTLEDPFAARPDGASSFNTFTSTQARISPYIQRNITPNLRYLIRSDNTWTKDYDSSQALNDVYFARHLIEVDSAPRPFGWTVTLERNDTKFEGTQQPTLTTDIGRVIASYALSQEFVVNARAGYESNNFVTTDNEGAIYGAGVTWRPTPRTDLTGFWEDRFFGSGWRLGFNHRHPRVAWNLTTSRDISNFAQTLFELPPTANVAALLDAIFTTRFPDPTERARIVQDVLNRQGLPGSTARAVNIYGQRISLVTAHTATVTLIGVRSTLALSAFSSRIEELVDTSAFPVTGVAQTNNRQTGGTIAAGHQLTSNLGMAASVTWTRVRGIGAVASEETKQQTARVSFNRPLGPRTTISFGGRYQQIESNVTTESHEGAIFAGITHTF